jgi:tRNA-splicing ligase RtcB
MAKRRRRGQGQGQRQRPEQGQRQRQGPEQPSAQKRDFQRVGELVWELPKDFRADMRVPARLFGDAELFDAAFRDRTVGQLTNVATLPGIVKYAMAMPDFHQGYGFPIGGVAAIRQDTGVISPGGVGYDINCLAGESRVLHEHGYTVPIAQLEGRWEHARLRCQDFGSEREASTPIVHYFRQKPNAPVCRLVTETGDEITATADHPFWTLDGMRPLGELWPGELVAIYPFEGVEYRDPGDKIIVSEVSVDRFLQGVGKGKRGNAASQIKTHLRRRDLLPLRADSPALPYLLKLLGYVLGDGTIYFTGGIGKGITWFYGQRHDLEAIRRDVTALGFTPSRVYSRHREHRLTTTYDTYEFEQEETSFKVVGSGFAALLAILGAPIGAKASQDFEAPTWLFDAPHWQQRLFLAAFFGAELSAPTTVRDHGANFYTPVLSMNKREGFVDSGRGFLADIGRLLNGFGVEVKTISSRAEQRNRDGSRSVRLRLILSSKPESLINLWSRVGFEYNRKRHCLSLTAIQYLKEKQFVVAERHMAAETAQVLQAAGVSPTEIYADLSSDHVNRRFLERSLYEGRKTPPRVDVNFPHFETYREEATAGLGESGMVWARIARIERLDDFDKNVYDFTVAHSDHNFIANRFVVSNCGVRLLGTHLEQEEIAPYLQDLTAALYRSCPSGVGGKGRMRVSERELDELVTQGAKWALKKGLARQDDVTHTEEQGHLAGADPGKVSARAKERGRPQVGSLGAGNHFLEIDVVEEVYDTETADVFGLWEGQIAVQIHCGSRGFGHQVCDDYVKSLQPAVHKYNIQLPDRELVCAPIDSPEGQAYYSAMACAVNYAFVNRQVLAMGVREAFEQVLAGKVRDFGLFQVYDVAHNIAKFEEHEVDGQPMRLCVHRKGATRAFGPGHRDLSPDYRDVGQPVLVPGSMGTASYVLVGTQKAMDLTFGSTCHGAGRTMSRSKARKSIWGADLQKELEEQGIVVRAGSAKGLAEEAPAAYKDVSRVVEVVHGLGIARKVARLRPISVIKG